jgi:tRNA pseudouridine38-40 synthase
MRLQIDVAYHGGGFNGWQSQADGNTIQDFLQAAFTLLCGQKILIHGAGRTDAGVHAEAQSAHADVPDGRLTVREWVSALNAHLPREIRVMDATEVAQDFHARFSALGKIYRYTIWNAPSLSPLERDRAWHVPGKLDLERLRQACELFTGTHDFAAFSAKRDKKPESTVRTIHSIQPLIEGQKIQLFFEGEGFLYKMVRILSAAIVRHANGRCEVGDLSARLGNGQPSFQHSAPACGLCLVRVIYPAA